MTRRPGAGPDPAPHPSLDTGPGTIAAPGAMAAGA